MIPVLLITTVIFAIWHLVLSRLIISALPGSNALIFAMLLLYVPLWIRRRHPQYVVFLEHTPRSILMALLTFLIASLLIFPPYMAGVYVWEKVVFGARVFDPAVWPGFNESITQLLLIALPEETFFRGYMHTRLQQIIKPRWHIFGVRLGWGWVLTAAIFALCHSLILVRWWHFSIFFPALIFGYLRERTGGLIAPILFHAFSNLFMQWVTRSFLY